ncbi:LytR/AlgR family response regulator transcription factor [Thermoactinomyces mirandus]|uniref:Response regulator transcription factor n=1 Tax=Thermoactinomyces mirandus TaxID=2756294 RepID=A0A7W2ARZ5_9BACL|nr:LytTR family DNA-binding domain-containing protein [Thermoactinomyces mirandus]MBA4602150.1 response regulator transcription factor [Thermoactinomyces mirandus]
MKLKAYIVDDEPLAREELKYLLNQSKQVEVVGESDFADGALRDIARLKPDIVFLDIELDEENGLDLAKQLEKLNPTPAIVVATAYDEYALQAFDTNAIDYILKPFGEERIMHTLEKLRNLQKIGKGVPVPYYLKNDRNGKIAVSANDKIVLLSFDEILFFESFEGKCIIKTLKQEYKINEALVEVEKKVNHAQFLRVHRSYIVNLDHIEEIQPWFNSTCNLIMKDSSRVPVSRTYMKELKRIIGF